MPAHNHTKHFYRMRVCECDGAQTAHGGQQSPRHFEEHQKKCVSVVKHSSTTLEVIFIHQSCSFLSICYVLYFKGNNKND